MTCEDLLVVLNKKLLHYENKLAILEKTGGTLGTINYLDGIIFSLKDTICLIKGGK